MTIIQAQPLKQFGISGPASALDNEIAVFDGVTGKKIKAATGIICPSSGRLDLAEIRAKDGNGLKLYDDGGNGIFVEDGGSVGVYTTIMNQKLNIVGNIRIDGQGTASAYVMLNDTDGRATALGAGQSNSVFLFDSAGGFQIQARTKEEILAGSSSSSSGKLTVLANGKVGIVTIDPTAKLDIDSDILRLRTAKTPATAGAVGNQGDICWDANYIYACTATNTWKRTALTTW